MKKLILLVLLAASVGTLSAEPLNRFLFTCEPWDTNGCVFVTPGQDSPVDNVVITLLNDDFEPIEGAHVVIDFSNCPNMIYCSPDGLSGVTNAAGQVLLNPSVGGCDDCVVVVRAEGQTICFYQSPGPGLPTVRSAD